MCFSELVSEKCKLLLSTYCCSIPVLFQFLSLHWGTFLFLNVVWKDFVNDKLLGIDNNNATFVFSYVHNYSQQIISSFFRVPLYTLCTWSFPVPTERSSHNIYFPMQPYLFLICSLDVGNFSNSQGEEINSACYLDASAVVKWEIGECVDGNCWGSSFVSSGKL